MMAEKPSWLKRVKSAMTIKHVHPANVDQSTETLLELNRRCLQRLRVMRAESRSANNSPISRLEKGRAL